MADSTSSGGISFGGLLAIVFITLKLTGYIDWSWWWVLSPFWIPLVIFFGVLLIGSIVTVLVALISGKG
jgi:hypothetical protein